MNKERREKIKDNSFDNLINFKKVLDGTGMEFWISCGTLLGLYRDGDLLKSDEHDVDVSLWKRDVGMFISILPQLRELGFRFNPEYLHADPLETNGIGFRRGKAEIHVNFFIPKKDGDKAFYWMGNVRGSDKHYAYVFPAKLFREFEKIKWRGVEFNRPKDIEGYLVARYGKIWRKDLYVSGEWTHCRDKKFNPCLRDDLSFENFKHYEIDKFYD